jgi:hypothetical protein
MATRVTSAIPSFYRRVITNIREGPLAGKWLFAWVFLSQLGRLIQHITKQLSGSGLHRPSYDSEVSQHNLRVEHLGVLTAAFNGGNREGGGKLGIGSANTTAG